MADHPESDLYVRKKGRVFGPYNFETLQGLAQKGQLSRIHEVSEDGINWIRAGKYQPPIWEKWAAPATPPPQPEVPEISAEAENLGSAISPSSQIAPADADQQWYYTQNEQEMGPIGFAQLQQLFATGGLASHEEVWTEGMSDWQPAAEVSQFAFCFNKPEQPTNSVSPSGSIPSITINTASNTGQAGGQAGGKPAGFSITSMVLGIPALFTCWFGILLGILAIIFGFVALGKVSSGVGGGKGMAITGLVCGILAVVGWLLLFVCLFILQVGAAGQSF